MPYSDILQIWERADTPKKVDNPLLHLTSGLAGMAEGMKQEAPKGLVARFEYGLSRMPSRPRASTYLALMILAFLMAGLGMAEIGLEYQGQEDIALILHGLGIGVLLTLPASYADVAFHRQQLKQLLVIIPALALSLMWFETVIGPGASDHEFTMLASGFLVSCMLGAAAVMNLIRRYKRDLELGFKTPVRTQEEMDFELMREVMGRTGPDERHRPGGWTETTLAILFIILSAGAMLWVCIHVATDPQYHEGMMLSDWLGILGIACLNLASLIVLAKAVEKGELRLLLLAGTLSGFSVLGALVVIGQLLAWNAHRKGGGMPWKAEPGTPRPGEARGRFHPPAGPKTMEHLVTDEEFRQIEARMAGNFRNLRRSLQNVGKVYGVIIEVDDAPASTLPEEARELRIGIERILQAAELSASERPKGIEAKLSRFKSELEFFRSLETRDEAARRSVILRHP
jgi:hypothetical protein